MREKHSPIVEWRFEESIYGVKPERRSIFFAVGPSPEVTQPKNEGKERAENIENSYALLFVFAVSRQSLPERN